jgi:RNA polymerase primary sigma factor
MKSAPSRFPSEPEPNTHDILDAEERSAPVSRVRGSAPRDFLGERDTLALYYADLADRRPLTRDDEVALGRRIEAAARAILRAWLQCPRARRELALTAEDVRSGALAIEDLLEEPDGLDPAAIEVRSARLAQLLERVRAFAAAPPEGAAGERAIAEIVAGLADLPLDPALGERVERSLRQAASAAAAAERAEIEASLNAIARARRALARARSELVEANLRLAISIARQFHRHDVPLADLAQEGNIGLMRAAERFDYRRGHRFSTYATWWIKQAIRRALLRQGRGLRMPAHLADARSRIARVRRELVNQHGREPSPEEIAEKSGVALDRVRVIGEMSLETLSLDAPVGEDGDTSFGELVAGSEPMPDEILAKRRLVEHARELLDGLPAREREILERRYGLVAGEEETLEEIGRSCSLTRERIRQIEARALERLRTRSRAKKLDPHVEG